MFNIAATNKVNSVFKYVINGLKIDDSIKVRINKKVKWNQSKLELYPDAQKVLDIISKRYDIFLIANQSRPIEQRLKEYGVLQYIKRVICSCDVGCSKPDVKIFKLAETNEQNIKNEIWMIGDRIDNDIVPTNKLGWKTIQIKQGIYKDCEPINEYEKANYIVDGLLGVLPILI
jgi:HAD superfamily hydrolase (TIGR01549 family)